MRIFHREVERMMREDGWPSIPDGTDSQQGWEKKLIDYIAWIRDDGPKKACEAAMQEAIRTKEGW